MLYICMFMKEKGQRCPVWTIEEIVKHCTCLNHVREILGPCRLSAQNRSLGSGPGGAFGAFVVNEEIRLEPFFPPPFF